MYNDRYDRPDLGELVMEDRSCHLVVHLGFAEQNALLQLGHGEHYKVLSEIDVTPLTDLDDHYAWLVEFRDSTRLYLIRHNGRHTTCHEHEFDDYVERAKYLKKMF